ncbi:hypothetical protein LXL04_003558 [Taraxacum kok-saghyz]
MQVIFDVGDEVEVNGKPEERRLYFYVAIVERLNRLRVVVRYRDLKLESGESLTEEVGVEYLRLKPVNVRYHFRWGDVVDVWVVNRWWKCRIGVRMGRGGTYCVTYRPDTDFGDFCRMQDVRVSYT